MIGFPRGLKRTGRSALKVIKRYAFLAVKRASYLPRIRRRDRFSWFSRPRERSERWVKKKKKKYGRRERMRDAKVCAMRKFVANFTRLRSEAEERWNRAQPVLWVVPFYFRHKNSSRRRFAANYFPLGKKGGREEGMEYERCPRMQQQNRIHVLDPHEYILRR